MTDLVLSLFPGLDALGLGNAVHLGVARALARAVKDVKEATK